MELFLFELFEIIPTGLFTNVHVVFIGKALFRICRTVIGSIQGKDENFKNSLKNYSFPGNRYF